MRWAEFDTLYGVYMAGFGDYVKIGWSQRLGARLRELEVGTPETLTLYLVFPDVGSWWEKSLHKRFAEYRSRNEWFRLEGALREYVKKRSMRPFDDDEPDAKSDAMVVNAPGMKAVLARPGIAAARRAHLELVRPKSD